MIDQQLGTAIVKALFASGALPVALRNGSAVLASNPAHQKLSAGLPIDRDAAGARLVWESTGDGVPRLELELPLNADGLCLRAVLDEVASPDILRNVPAFIFGNDAEGRVLYISAEYFRVTGLTPERQSEWITSIHPEDAARVLRIRGAAIRRGDDYRYDFRLKMRDGQHRWHRAHAVARGGPGEALRWYGVAYDIQELVEAQSALRDDEIRFGAMLAVVPDAVAVCAQDGTIEAFSPGAERLFGCAAHQAIGGPIAELAPAAAAPSTESGPTAVLPDRHQPGASGVRHVTIRRPSGTMTPVELRVTEARLAERPVFVAVFRDLTDVREADRRLRIKRAELAHAARLKTLGEMTAVIAEEASRPLAAAANFIRAAERSLPTASGEEDAPARLLKAACGQILQAGETMRRVQAFARRPEPASKPVDLRDLVAEAAELVLIGCREAGLKVDLEFCGPSVRVFADGLQIQQVVMNLVRNALEAMGETPGRWLKISVRRANDQGIVVVEDNGPGVPAAVEDSLFQSFATTKPDGAGIGLAISRTLIEAHGGRLTFEPREEGGANFTFSLPLLTEDVSGVDG